MAGRVLKTTKDKVELMLGIMRRVPSDKITDLDKHQDFLRAIKAVVRDYLDETASVVQEFKDVQLKESKKLASLKNKIELLEKEGPEDKKELNDLRVKFAEDEDKLNIKKIEVNEKLASLYDGLKLKKVEVNFNNEDFLYAKTLVKENATKLFLAPDGRSFDDERADIVFDLLESVE